MRILATIPHPEMRISIFHINDKYIVKFEAGPMEQAYKFNQEDTGGPEQLAEVLDDAFMNNVLERFKEMFSSLKEVKKKLSDRL